MGTVELELLTLVAAVPMMAVDPINVVAAVLVVEVAETVGEDSVTAVVV